MNEIVKALLAELADFGAINDPIKSQRSDKMLNITPDTGVFLALVVQAVKARRVLEVGTSNGYSTIWLGDAARQVGGTVTTLEVLPHKAEMALENFRRAGLENEITLVLGDAGGYMQDAETASFDMIFLDSDRTSYLGWWPHLQRLLAPGGLMIVDNATSHRAELVDFVRAVDETPGYITSLVPLGNGELLVLKQS